MAETDNDLVTTLSKKIDDQSRFTRIVVVLCCLTVIGCLSYAISTLVYALPDLMLAKTMGNLEMLFIEWKAMEKLPASKLSGLLSQKHGGGPAPTTTTPTTTTSTTTEPAK